MQSLSKKQIERFWRKAKRTKNGCLVWQHSKIWSGYGRCSFNGNNNLRAHRVSFFITYGYMPEMVLHKCDNPPCIEPDHLFEGSQLENMRDCKKKNRDAKGEKQGSSKLTVDKIRSIRKSKKTLHELADKYGVAFQTIGKIKRHQRWSHV